MKSYVRRCGWFVCLLSAICLTLTWQAGAQSLTQLSQDTFAGGPGQHQSEVEPSAFTYGSTIVTAFQVARVFGGGGMDIGFATSKDGGSTWTNGYLPGLTIYQGGGAWDEASDAAVAYDAKHGVWLIATLPIGNTLAVAVSRSTDGLSWGNPVLVNQSGGDDKDWIVCDNTKKSSFYGNCYVEWDDGGFLQMSTSTDGGVTWGPAMGTAGGDFGIGGLPLVQPNGTVIVPFLSFNGGVAAFSSTNGGASWNAAVNVASFINHAENGDIRSAGLPSAGVDAVGRVWVAWSDCRFRSGCSSNDIVYTVSAKSSKKGTWGAVQRIPIDAITSTVDHFITGLAIEPGTSGKKTHVGLAYYYYPVSNCSTCQLFVGFIQTTTNGKTWSAPVSLGGPMDLSWLPDTFSGRMVADYIAVGFGTGGKAYPVFALAGPLSGGLFQQGTYTTSSGLAPSGPENEPMTSQGNMPVPYAHSDHGPMQYFDQEHRIPISGQRPPESHE
jgi:hypothetical protein